MELSFSLAKGVVAKCVFAKAWACSAELEIRWQQREKRQVKMGFEYLWANSKDEWTETGDSQVKGGCCLQCLIPDISLYFWEEWFQIWENSYCLHCRAGVGIVELLEKGRWQGKDRKGQIFIFL